jgi:hypothetical protein
MKVPIVSTLLLAWLLALFAACVGSPEEAAAFDRLSQARAALDGTLADPSSTPEQVAAAQEALVLAATEYAKVQGKEIADGITGLPMQAELLLEMLAGLFGLHWYRNRTRAKALVSNEG